MASIIPYLQSLCSSPPELALSTEAFLSHLPKVELHVHLDGAYDLDLIYAANEPLQQQLSLEEFKQRSQCHGHRSLSAMFQSFDIFTPLVKDDFPLIEKLSRRFVESQASQNVIYTEVRYCPQLLGDDIDKVMAVVTAGLLAGCREFGVEVKQILCCLDLNPEWSVDIVNLAANHRRGRCGVVGVDIAGGEGHFGQHQDPHREAIDLARAAGIRVAMHAGEVGGATNVRKAVEHFGAVRVGHGYALAEPVEERGEGAGLLEGVIMDEGVHLEVCPTSSYETGGWTGEDGDRQKWKKHPLRTFVDAGVSVSLSSDDPTVFGTSITREYRIALEEIGLSRRQLVGLVRNAIEASFASKKERQKCIKALDKFVKKARVEG